MKTTITDPTKNFAETPLPAPLVSVIVPFYNSEPYLAECIESVLIQEYTNWELILVDDGSTDNSTAIAEGYVKKFPGLVRCISHPGRINRGLCASRNAGVAESKGEYIALLDSDDVWTEKKLQHQVGLIAKYPQCTLFCEASLYWNSWGPSRKGDKVVAIGVPSERVYSPPQLILNLYPLKKGATPCPSSLLIKKETVLKVGGFEESFNKKYSLYEDQAFFFKIYLNEPVFVSSACNNYYRLRPGSLMAVAKNKEQYRQVQYFFFRWAKAYLKNSKDNYPEIDQALAKAIRSYKMLALRRRSKKVLHYIAGFFKGWKTLNASHSITAEENVT